MKAMSAGPVLRADVASVMERDDETASRLVEALLAEGMCQADRLTLRLPLISVLISLR